MSAKNIITVFPYATISTVAPKQRNSMTENIWNGYREYDVGAGAFWSSLPPYSRNLKSAIVIPMRNLSATLCLTLCTCVLVTSAVADFAPAEEIAMICTLDYDGKTHTRIHKYSNPRFLKKWRTRQIYQRLDGKWEKWCRPDEVYYKPCELTVSDKGAVGTFYFKDTLTKSYKRRPAGSRFVKVAEITLDFEFLKRRVGIHYETLSGRRIWGDDESLQRWSCKLHN